MLRVPAQELPNISAPYYNLQRPDCPILETVAVWCSEPRACGLPCNLRLPTDIIITQP